VNGFYDDLLVFVRHAVGQGFIKAHQVDALVVADGVDELLDGLMAASEDQVAAR
jgi:predicted Rossmann-fold nucleotide-binding protein